MQHLRLVLWCIKEFVPARAHDGSKHVDAEDRLTGKKYVKQAGDLAERRNVVRIHGQHASKGKKGLCPRQVTPELGVAGTQDVRDEAQLADGRSERRQHKVTDPQGREPCHRRCADWGRENQEEYLADVMVALKVAEVRIAAQHLDDQGRKFILLPREFSIILIWYYLACGSKDCITDR